MMPNGGNMNPWMSHQWYNPAASLGSNQAQGMVDVNALHMMASQQFPHQYGAGILPVAPAWNDVSSQSQWMQQWQSNFQTKYMNINHEKFAVMLNNSFLFSSVGAIILLLMPNLHPHPHLPTHQLFHRYLRHHLRKRLQNM